MPPACRGSTTSSGRGSDKISAEAGKPLTAIVRDLFDAIDPDKVEADAKAAGHPEPDDAAMEAAREERINRPPTSSPARSST